jgi:hypothetical protein
MTRVPKSTVETHGSQESMYILNSKHCIIRKKYDLSILKHHIRRILDQIYLAPITTGLV